MSNWDDAYDIYADLAAAARQRGFKSFTPGAWAEPLCCFCHAPILTDGSCARHCDESEADDA